MRSVAAAPRPRQGVRLAVRSRLLAGATLAVAVALPSGLSAQEAPVGPVSAQQPVGSSTPPPGQQPASPPAPAAPGTETPGEAEPVGPVQPVRTFDPVPLPGELQQAAPATPGTTAPVLPTAPINLGPAQAGMVSPIVPGAAEAGRVVPDNRGLYGRDFLPDLGASAIAAAGLRASAGFRASYDSNIARVPNGVELPPDSGISKSSWILRPDLQVGAGRNLGQQLFFVNADIGRDFFLSAPNRNQNRISVNGGVDWRLGASCGGRVLGAWTTRENSAQDFLVGVPGGTENTVLSFSGTCNSGAGLVPSFNAAVGQVRFEPEFREVSDVDFWSLGGALGYQLNPTLQVGAQVGYQSSTFPNQPLLPELDPDGERIGITSLSVSGFASYVIAASLNASAALGWTTTSSNNPLIRDFSGLTGNISIAHAGPRYGLAFNFGRDVNLGNTGGSNLRIRSTLGLTGSYRLTSQATLGTGFAFNRDDNRGDVRFGSPFNLVDQEFWRAFARAGYRVNDRLNFSLGYRYEARESQDVIFEGLPAFELPGFRSHNVDFALRFQFL